MVRRRHPVGNLDTRVGSSVPHTSDRRPSDSSPPYRLDVVVADPYLTGEEARALGGHRGRPRRAAGHHGDVVSLPHAGAARHRAHDRRRPAGPHDGRRDATVNTARGALVNHDALVAEVKIHRAAHCRARRHRPEPLPDDHPLHLAGCLVTPHLAGSQGTGLNRLADLTIEEVRRFAAGKPALRVTATTSTASHDPRRHDRRSPVSDDAPRPGRHRRVGLRVGPPPQAARPSGRHAVGVVLTQVEPADHPWQRGLWFVVKYVDGDNFWEELPR